jgi:hypothetical protein
MLAFYTQDLIVFGPGAALPTTTHRHVHIFRRQLDGHWNGWRLMENSSDPAPAPAAAPAAPKPAG